MWRTPTSHASLLGFAGISYAIAKFCTVAVNFHEEAIKNALLRERSMAHTLHFALGEMKQPTGRKPRFKINDNVRIVGPTVSERTHDTGTVTEVVGIGAGADTILRYRVTFPDGTNGTFFGFELELIPS
ncbi:MAG TPA: hypothetical protein VGK48_07745 [Terriglobia bacterium]